MTTTQPNILVLMADQFRFDALGCAGNARIHTPHLDGLAATGVRFNQACTPFPLCVPGRQSFITGHRTGRHRWVRNRPEGEPKPELPTLMTLLHQAGYHTHAVGKMHFWRRHYGLEVHERMEENVRARIDDDYLTYLKTQGVRSSYPHGLRELLYLQPQTNGMPLEHSPSAWVTQRAIACLCEHVRYRDRRLFLWASWTGPHPPFAPCEPYDSMYDPQNMDLPIYPDRPLATLPYPAWAHRARLDGTHLDPERLRRVRALYYGLITQIDAGIGQILAELDNLGLRENTVVLFASDHGDMLGDHGLSQKNVPYEPSVRIPMLLRWPGRTEAGRVCHDLVSLTDFLPTLTAELQLQYPEDACLPEGASLLSRNGGGLGVARDGYFIDYGSGEERWVCLRTHRYKYALWAAGGMEEVYDLEADPHELHNLIAEQPALAREMRARTVAWEREHGLPLSFEGGRFRTYLQRPVPCAEPRGVVVDGERWRDRLPEDERSSVESYAEAFSRAIVKETTLTPDKVSIADYKRKGGKPLIGTPWERAWEEA